MRSRTLAEHPLRTYAVVFDEGDEVAEGLERFARESGVASASFTAIGAVSEATIGFFDPERADYLPTPITQQAEVLSLVGDITRSDDAGDAAERTVHGHIVLGLPDGTVRGGHLMDARVRPTLEVMVTESPGHLRRRHDRASGLALIDLAGGERTDPGS